MAGPAAKLKTRSVGWEVVAARSWRVVAEQAIEMGLNLRGRKRDGVRWVVMEVGVLERGLVGVLRRRPWGVVADIAMVAVAVVEEEEGKKI